MILHAALPCLQEWDMLFVQVSLWWPITPHLTQSLKTLSGIHETHFRHRLGDINTNPNPDMFHASGSFFRNVDSETNEIPKFPAHSVVDEFHRHARKFEPKIYNINLERSHRGIRDPTLDNKEPFLYHPRPVRQNILRVIHVVELKDVVLLVLGSHMDVTLQMADSLDDGL